MESVTIVIEVFIDLPISRVEKVFESKDDAISYAKEMNEIAEKYNQKIEYRVLDFEVIPSSDN